MPKPEPLPEPIRRGPLVALIRYARDYKLDLYADAYRIRPAESSLHERTPYWLFETLHDWVFWLRVEGDALMARHRDYFWLRPSEISERALAPLEAKLRQNAEISLDEWAQLAISLSPMQTARVNEMYEIAGQAVAHDTPRGENSIKRIDIRTPSARREPPHFRLETQSIEPAPRYTVEGDEITAQPPENTAPMQALHLVFVGKEQERIYLLTSKP